MIVAGEMLRAQCRATFANHSETLSREGNSLPVEMLEGYSGFSVIIVDVSHDNCDLIQTLLRRCTTIYPPFLSPETGAGVASREPDVE